MMNIGVRRRTMMRGLFGLFLLAAGTGAAQAADLPKVAVTDLTYEQRVASWFTYYESNHRGNYQGGPYSGAGSHESSVVAASGEIVSIERGELHKFTGDIRGALIKSGAFRVIQGKPWTQPDTATIYDIIDRIKKGYYAGADYVLFGTITAIDSHADAVNIQGSNATNYILNMELVCDFSLINTKTYEIKAGFTAMGEGSDSKLVNTAGTVISLSRPRVMREVSASLAENVLAEVTTQFGQGSPAGQASPASSEEPEKKTIIYR